MIHERIKNYPDGITNVFRRFPLALFFSLAATLTSILDHIIRFRFTRINGVDCIKEYLNLKIARFLFRYRVPRKALRKSHDSRFPSTKST